jgi:hypothetical protein
MPEKFGRTSMILQTWQKFIQFACGIPLAIAQ